jgi:hypothetical protein
MQICSAAPHLFLCIFFEDFHMSNMGMHKPTNPRVVEHANPFIQIVERGSIFIL